MSCVENADTSSWQSSEFLASQSPSITPSQRSFGIWKSEHSAKEVSTLRLLVLQHHSVGLVEVSYAISATRLTVGRFLLDIYMSKPHGMDAL